MTKVAPITPEEVKPCPFCGGEVEMWKAFEMPDGFKGHAWIGCIPCVGHKHTGETVSAERPTDAEMIAQWNTRPTEDALRAEILTLIAKNGQLIEENRALRARVEELEKKLNE